jgi:hypothetical protein
MTRRRTVVGADAATRAVHRVAVHAKTNETVKAAASLLDVGPLTATVVVATVDDSKPIKSGAQFGAWIGPTPWQHSPARATASCAKAMSTTRWTGPRQRGTHLTGVDEPELKSWQREGSTILLRSVPSHDFFTVAHLINPQSCRASSRYVRRKSDHSPHRRNAHLLIQELL